jgi:AcrR family transcriptional regulator
MSWSERRPSVFWLLCCAPEPAQSRVEPVPTLPTTPKGIAQSEAIIAAAQQVIARDGYAATSLARVAEEAGITKRMVLYYFATRDQLIDVVMRRLGDQIVGQLHAAVEDLDGSPESLPIGFRRVWTSLTEDPVLIGAYFGLVSEAVVDEHLRGAVTHVNAGFDSLLDDYVTYAEAVGRKLLVDEGTFRILALAGARGLFLEFLERGATPELERAIDSFEQALTAVLGLGQQDDRARARPALCLAVAMVHSSPDEPV